MTDDPLKTTLLDLLFELRAEAPPFLLGGGYGLFLKQIHLQDQGIRTLIKAEQWPPPRATNDLDLFLRAEIVTDSARMARTRTALVDQLRCTVIEASKYWQFARVLDERRQVKMDLLTGSLDQCKTPGQVRIDDRRVKPIPSVQLHARNTPEALGIEDRAFEMPLGGVLSSGEAYQCSVLIPNAFAYMLMKLHAFHDRKEDARRDLARHHAFDLYRIVAMLTEEEYEHARLKRAAYLNNPHFQKGLGIAQQAFGDVNSIGVIRIRELSRDLDASNLDVFIGVLKEIF